MLSTSRSSESARTALISGMLIALVLLWLAMGPVPALSALAAVAAVDWVFTTRTKARLGGFTGDTIGAAQQLTELVLLAVLALWL